MTWVRLDDGLSDHPKFVGLPLAAVGLWTLCLSYTGKRRSPLIPAGLPSRFGATAAHAASLVAAGLWEVADGGWHFHDWREYAESPSTERTRRYRERHGNVTGTSPEDSGTVPAGTPVPDPVPDPVPLSSESVRRAPRRFLTDAAVEAYRSACSGMGVTVTPAAMAGIGSAAADCRNAGASEADLVAAAIRCAERGGNPARMDIDLAAIQRQRNGNSLVAGQRRVEALLAEEAS